MVRSAISKTCKWTCYLFAALVILIALLAVTLRLAIFYSEDYSDKLASLASAYLGGPVDIGDIDLVWNRFDASASLKDVRIHSADGAETLLELPLIDLQLNVRDILLQRHLSVRSVQLSDLSLAISYDGRGKLSMLGLNAQPSVNDAAGDISTTLNPDSAVKESVVTRTAANNDNRSASVLEWLFNAKRIAILNSDVTLHDSKRGVDYEVDDVNIRVFNDDELHQIRVSSALPGAIGQDTLASFDFTGQADDISAWEGQFYVNAQGLNLTQISLFTNELLQTYSGTTDLQLWGDWKGTRVNKLRAQVAGRDIEISQPASNAISGNARTMLATDQLEMDLEWVRTDSGWQAKFHRFMASFDQDVTLDGLDLHVERDPAGDKRFRVSGPEIDLAALQPIYRFIDGTLAPETPYRADLLRSGQIRNWLVGGILLSEGVSVTELVADVDNLAVDPFDTVPGVSGLSTHIYFHDGVGRISIDNQNINVFLPTYFDKPLPAINVDGDLKFVISSDWFNSAGSDDLTTKVALSNTTDAGVLWRIVSDELKLSTIDLNTSTVFSLQGTSDGRQLVNLHTNVINANLSNIEDYYPARIIKPKVLAWLQNSIQGGDVVRGRLELKGDLANFAPRKGQGHFYAESDLANATVKFRPDWPAAVNMDGNVSFSTSGMRARVYQGNMRQAKFNDARLYIPDFKQAILELQYDAIGPLDDMLDFLQTGPLANKVGQFLGDATGDGVSRLAVDLKIPLKKELRDQLSVDGEVILDNAQLAAAKFGIDLESATGKLRFNRTGIEVDDLLVRYQGIPLDVKATQEKIGGVERNRLSVSGPVALASLMQSYGIPVTDQFEGLSDWDLHIDITRRGAGRKAKVELTAVSDLAGTELKFPVPISKSSKALRDVRVYRDFSAVDKDWWVEMPGLAKARFRIGTDKKLEAMAVALGGSNNTILPWRGIALQGNVATLDASGWIKLALGFRSNRKSDSEPFPIFAKINAQQMLLGEQVPDTTGGDAEFVYIAYRDGPRQVHRVESELVSGELFTSYKRQSNDPVVVRLDRLDKRLLTAIGADNSASATQLVGARVTSPSYDPVKLPPLDVSVSEVKWKNWRLQKVGLRTQPTDRGLRITALTARQDSLRISGSGAWEMYTSAGVTSHATTLDLNATFDDFGRAISLMSGVKSFAKGAGEVALSLSWPSAAYAPDIKAILGQLLFNLRDGRILSVDPGAGRILGLFALQALPRRLALDFRDLTDTGLEYANISGNLSIANGQAKTNAIAVTGPVAEILIHGSTDIVAKTYDQKIDVVPRVSGALPILGVLSGGPAAGLTALLADSLLKEFGVNLDEIGLQRYALTGSWDEPDWRTVNTGGGRSR